MKIKTFLITLFSILLVTSSAFGDSYYKNGVFYMASLEMDLDAQGFDITGLGILASSTYGSDGSISDAELLTIDDGATTQMLVGGGAGSAPVWGADIPTAVTIGSAYVYRVGGTDVADADVVDTLTITNISQVADISATASEINTPLDGATVTLAEFQQLQTIGATTISANQWATLGGIAETLTSAELDILDGVTGVTAAELGYIGDVTSLIQAQIDLKAPLASPAITTGTFVTTWNATNAAGPSLADEAATTTNPTLIPNKAEMDTGIGWASDTLHFVLGGADEYSFSTTEANFKGNYAVQLQNIPDLASKGKGYWFDGVDDKVTTGTSATAGLDDSTPFSIVSRFKTTDSGNNVAIIGAWKGGSGENSDIINVQLNSGTIVFYIIEAWGTPRISAATTATFNNGLGHTVVATYNGSGANTGLLIYADGALQATSLSGTGTISAFVTTDTVGIGNNTNWSPTVWFEGEINSTYIFNLTLTAAEAKAYSSGAPVPYKYIGASQTELMPNAIDRNFTGGATAWANVDINAFDETTDLTITATAADQYCTLAVASAPTTIGKRYRLTYDLANIVSTWTVKDFTGVQTIGTISANATQGTLEWTATTTGGYRLVSTSTTSSGDFDNFTLTQIGAVLQLEQAGIGQNQWIDTSGNELHGTVSGALPTNRPAHDREKYVDLTVTGDSNFTLPKGYQIKSIIVKETAGNALTGGLDVGTSDGGVEVVSAMAVGANATVLTTLVAAGTIGGTFTTADDIIYFTDGDDDANWNSASLEARVEMERLSVGN